MVARLKFLSWVTSENLGCLNLDKGMHNDPQQKLERVVCVHIWELYIQNAEFICLF